MDASQIARRFPLIARPRPACPPLSERLREINELAASAERDGDLLKAAVAQNKAALIASDCGLTALARTLCWAHAQAYLGAPEPLTGRTARLALEPLVNLARLRIRSGDGDKAYEILSTLFRAVGQRLPQATVDGRPLSLTSLPVEHDERRAIVQWLWTVLLADGTRALTGGGRWREALDAIEQHKGIGGRLLDGRQVAVLARLDEGEWEAALELLSTAQFGEPWEEDVASCLTVASLEEGSQPTEAAVTRMARRYLDGHPEPGLVVFRTQWGLTVLDLSAEERTAQTVIRRLVDETLGSSDGYAARELLEHPSADDILTAETRRALLHMAEASGLRPSQALPGVAAEIQRSASTAQNVTLRLQQSDTE
ncbi:hypothetical protein ACIQCR_17035 [Streptomyces sp. NPDC093249]|uniref:hypothetical protein n=1 Tax=unclassified Streptomyces TaxID=2593676 RepID=UPI003450227B